MQAGYLSGFGEILIYILAGIVFLLLTLLTSRLVRPSRPNAEKLATYESGEEPISSAWSQFNVRFYIVALIFILFEVELVFLFPWSVVFSKKQLIEQTNGTWGWFVLIEMFVFIFVLALGLAYAWANGFLDWMKPSPKPGIVNSPVPKTHYEALNRKYAVREKTIQSTEEINK